MSSAPPSAPPPKPGSHGNVHAIKPAKHRKSPLHGGGGDHGDGGAHDDSNWIISYADMMTLLCVFFVLMYSMANNPKKVEEMKKETTKYFGGHYKQPHEQLVDKIRDVVKEKGLDKMVEITSDEQGVSATFHGTVFFESGKTDLLAEGSDLLRKMGEVIMREAPGFKIVVEGHTDDSPMNSPIFPSNWELSGGRASRVIRLFESMGFSRKLLTAIGFSDTRPIMPNRDEAGKAISLNQAQNRRVVLRVLKDGA